MNFPAHYLAAENILNQIEVIEASLEGRGQ
jgi:hypothetical protein